MKTSDREVPCAEYSLGSGNYEISFALLTYIGTKKVQEKIKLTLSLTLLLTLTLNPQSTKLQSEIN